MGHKASSATSLPLSSSSPSSPSRLPPPWSKPVFLSSKLTAAVFLFVALMSSIQAVQAAGGDCMGSGLIECFECNSWEDPRCHDPFNYTIHPKDMPKIKMCEGCCVKMVQFIGTEHYQVKRTCTDNFEVNFFMVNHACMTEGHRHGHMCFCEEDMCNTGNQLRPGGGSNSNNAFMAAMLASVWAASKTNLLSS